MLISPIAGWRNELVTTLLGAAPPSEGIPMPWRSQTLKGHAGVTPLRQSLHPWTPRPGAAGTTRGDALVQNIPPKQLQGSQPCSAPNVIHSDSTRRRSSNTKRTKRRREFPHQEEKVPAVPLGSNRIWKSCTSGMDSFLKKPKMVWTELVTHFPFEIISS